MITDREESPSFARPGGQSSKLCGKTGVFRREFLCNTWALSRVPGNLWTLGVAPAALRKFLADLAKALGVDGRPGTAHPDSAVDVSSIGTEITSTARCLKGRPCSGMLGIVYLRQIRPTTLPGYGDAPEWEERHHLLPSVS